MSRIGSKKKDSKRIVGVPGWSMYGICPNLMYEITLLEYITSGSIEKKTPEREEANNGTIITSQLRRLMRIK